MPEMSVVAGLSVGAIRSAAPGVREMNWPWKREQPAIFAVEETEEDRLEIFANEYAIAKNELNREGEAVHAYERAHNVPPSVFVRDGKMYRAMNGRGDPVHTALKNEEQRARYRFGLKLRAFTEQKIRMGLVK